MAFALFLQRAARYWGDRPAVMHRERVLSFRQLDERSTRLANALLGLGLRPATASRCSRATARNWSRSNARCTSPALVKAALNPRFTAAEASDVVENCTPRAFIGGDGYTGYARTTPGFAAVEAFVALGGPAAGYLGYEDLLARGGTSRPPCAAAADAAVLHFPRAPPAASRPPCRATAIAWRRCARCCWAWTGRRGRATAWP